VPRRSLASFMGSASYWRCFSHDGAGRYGRAVQDRSLDHRIRPLQERRGIVGPNVLAVSRAREGMPRAIVAETGNLIDLPPGPLAAAPHSDRPLSLRPKSQELRASPA
jgi:hypothetical protein